MKMGIERRLKERIPEIQEVEQIMDTETVLYTPRLLSASSATQC